MENEALDAALILEDELKKRVHAVVERVVINIVGRVIQDELNKYKNEMLMEVCIAVGKTMRVAENEGRKPLWEATPEEFGLTQEDLNTHNIEKVTHAVCEQTPPLQKGI